MGARGVGVGLGRVWVSLVELGESLAFDHHRILADGVERARAKLEDSGYAAALCGETFTVADLHAVYESVWGIDLDKANFHRKVTGVGGVPDSDRGGT